MILTSSVTLEGNIKTFIICELAQWLHPQRWCKFPVHLKHSEADVEVLDHTSVPLVRFLHQGHQHGLLTTAGGASAQQLVNFDPVLRIDPEAFCEEGNVPVSAENFPFPKNRREARRRTDVVEAPASGDSRHPSAFVAEALPVAGRASVQEVGAQAADVQVGVEAAEVLQVHPVRQAS